MPVRFEPNRVAAVWAPGHTTGMVGSGYLLGNGLVLTARHVVDHAGDEGCEVRLLGTREWLAAERVWRGEHCDAALLRVPAPAAGEDPAARLGQVRGAERIACRALGFPFAQAREEGEVRDTEDLAGEIAPLTAQESGLLTVHIAGSVPTPDRSGHTPWEGMSGAALFSGPLIVGVIVVDPARFGTDRLEAVPITAMIAEPGFRQALTGDRDAGVALARVEDADLARGTLDAPYRPLPVDASPTALSDGATAFLLEPEYGIVPFHGREAELGEFETWCGGDGRLLVRLLCGPGGTGKTRLAAELCRRQQASGTVAGFLTARAGERAATLAGVTAPLLVVIDEAQSRLEEAAVLISELTRARRATPARVLLLARQAGDWWPTGLEDRLDDPDARFALAAGAVPRQVAPVEPAAREETFLAAAHAFAERLGRPLTSPRARELTGPVFEPILFVHLAALGLAEGETQPAHGDVVVADDLLAFALRREARYWASTARARDLEYPRSVLQQAVAVATLTTAGTQTEAARALTAIPDLDDAPQTALRNIARWLRDLYPVPPSDLAANPDAGDPAITWFRPLVPDLLGESLVAAALVDDQVPELVSNLLDRVSQPDQIHRILTVLTRAARSYPAARRALRQSLADHLSTLWEKGLIVAQQIGDPLGSLLADVLEQQPNPQLAADIEGSLPEQSVALRELAEVATRQALQHALAELPTLERDEHVAGLLNRESVRLGDLGRREEALAAIEEAVTIRRRLAAARPEAFLPQLAAALNNQTGCLIDLGRHEEALAAIEEAVTIRRELAAARPDAFLPVLADSLNNQSLCLSEVGRPEAALAAIEEAVGVYRELAAARPEAFLPDLGRSLTNQSHRLSDVGRREAALAASEEAVTIRRALAAARPDAFLPDLVAALNSQSRALSEVGRPEAALAASEEAVSVYRKLAAAHPDAFLPEFAATLNSQSTYLSEMGRREAALAASEEAVSVYRELAAAHPDDFLPVFARSLSNRSTDLSESGQLEAALAASEEAVGIFRDLAEERPDAFLPELAGSLTNLAIWLSKLERWNEALTIDHEAVAAYKRLAEAYPERFVPAYATWVTDLSVDLQTLGRGDEAVTVTEEGVRVVASLLERAPSLLADAGLSLVQRYIEMCREIGQEPDEELIERMHHILASAGALSEE